MIFSYDFKEEEKIISNKQYMNKINKFIDEYIYR